MGDLLFVPVVVAFFAAAALFVRWCDHLVGPDDLTGAEPVPEEPAAGTAPTGYPGHQGRLAPSPLKAKP